MLGFLLVGAGITQAASFDCKKARSFREKAICADPDLSRLDSALAEAYWIRHAALDEDAAAELRKEQRAWLKRLDAGPQRCTAAECLRVAYALRLEELRALAETEVEPENDCEFEDEVSTYQPGDGTVTTVTLTMSFCERAAHPGCDAKVEMTRNGKVVDISAYLRPGADLRAALIRHCEKEAEAHPWTAREGKESGEESSGRDWQWTERCGEIGIAGLGLGDGTVVVPFARSSGPCQAVEIPRKRLPRRLFRDAPAFP